MNWRKSKRVSLSMSFVAALGLIVAGCGSAKSGEEAGAGAKVTDKGAEKVELRFAWWGSQGRHDRTIKVIEKFQEQHPNIKIKPEYTTWTNYYDKLATQIAGSNAPDLITMSILYLKEYTDRGILLDMKPLAGKEIKVDSLDKNVLENQGTVNGKLTALPLGDNASVLIYNKEMYKQAGVEPPKMEMTWDEFFAKAREMKGKLGNNVYGSNDMSAIYESFMYYVFSSGDVMYANNKLGYKDETLKSWLEMWEKARKEGLVPPPNETASYQIQSVDPNKEPVIKGTVAIEGPLFNAHYAAFDGMLPGKLDMVTIPKASSSTKKNGSVLETASFISINAKSKHPKEAAMFIDFMVNSTEAADILEVERGIPDNKKTREYLAPRFTEKEKKMLSVLQHIEKSDPDWYDGGPKSAGAVGKLFEQIIQKQQFGKASIDEVVAEFRKEANKVFEKNN